MAKQNLNVLIIEDDRELLSMLGATVTKAGYTAFMAAHPREAEATLVQNKIDVVVADCLLPEKSGVEFICDFNTSNPNYKFKSILMSGIYTDKSYMTDAVLKAHAETFLRKPFSMDILLKAIAAAASMQIPKIDEVPAIVRARKSLYQLFQGEQSSRQKRRVIDGLEEIEGFDLPFVYSLLLSTKESGTLNIYMENGEVASVTFAKGNIVAVDVRDETTFLGKLLIQSGYVIPQDVQWVLQTKSNQRIGRALIENNRLSPHAFMLVLKDQMSLRISRTITKDKVRINFIPTDISESEPRIDEDDLFGFLHDWIGSKLTGQWLSSVYLSWNFYNVKFVEDIDFSHPVFDLPLLKNNRIQELIEKKSMRIGDLVNVDEKEQELIYKSLHLLLCRGILALESGGRARSEGELQKVLTKISGDIAAKNNLEIAEYFDHAGIQFRSGNVAQMFDTYLGFSPTNTKSKSYALYESLLNKIKEVQLIVMNDISRGEVQVATMRSEAENKLKGAQLGEALRTHLVRSQFAEAQKILTELDQRRISIPGQRICVAWTKIGLLEDKKNQNALREIELELSQVPPEERYEAQYPFVIGLLYKTKGNKVAAKKQYEKALGLDSDYLPARREMSLLESATKNQEGIWQKDLKTVVAGLFKKS